MFRESFDRTDAKVHTVVLPQATRFTADALPVAIAKIERTFGTEDGITAAAGLRVGENE